MATNTFKGTGTPMAAQQLGRPDVTHPLVAMKNTLFGGTLSVRGWVRNAAGVPQVRLMSLIFTPSMRVVARMYSNPADPQDFDYEFMHLNPGDERWAVVAWDPEGVGAPRMHDGIVPV